MNIKQHIDERQHGFFRGRSTVTNLVTFVQHLSESMDKRAQVDAVYTDFSKAFDKVHHASLLIKLENFGVHGNLLRWLKSYLYNRSQVVTIKNSVSSSVPVTSGVPQGSHLGPLLFLIFINDIGNFIQHSNYLLYADDMKIYREITNLHDALLLQIDLNNLYLYCTRNYLYLNLDKCYHITFTRNRLSVPTKYAINNHTLNSINKIKDLGVIVDSKLRFELHVEEIIQRSLRNLGFIFRTTTKFTNIKSFKILYDTLVRSHLEYASVVWNPLYYKYINRIERVQKKFIGKLNYKFNRDLHTLTYEYNLKKYNMTSLSKRRENFDIIFLYKVVNSLLSTSLISHVNINTPLYPLRTKNTFHVYTCKTSHCQNSPLYRVIYTYNSAYTHLDIFSLSLTSLKKILKEP